jgi:hypothetical protein
MATGTYGVSINGFSVNSQTWDDALQWDGKGDEVYIRANVVKLNSGAARRSTRASRCRRRWATRRDTPAASGPAR